MFASRNAASTYAQVGVETGVGSASPHKLILMLYDGAIVALSSAKRHLAENDVAAKGQDLSKAIEIISNGLCASLDIKAGGELAERLFSLYDYMTIRLLHANLHNDLAAIEEVSRLLGELRSAWEEIAADPVVVSANRPAA
ncbi:MAG TPA: flagellar export chaperone FliS [Rhodocyclaceae bacterium]|jgi:flagellar protein FliS|nr:flagellar export chaperone FliS [Rhodocyclaceae bacterium]